MEDLRNYNYRKKTAQQLNFNNIKKFFMINKIKIFIIIIIIFILIFPSFSGTLIGKWINSFIGSIVKNILF
jgi:uncharacterized membrane protein YvbJ